MASDRLRITRRDFLNGVALGGVAAGLAPAEALGARARDGVYYPPMLTGIRS